MVWFIVENPTIVMTRATPIYGNLGMFYQVNVGIDQ